MVNIDNGVFVMFVTGKHDNEGITAHIIDRPHGLDFNEDRIIEAVKAFNPTKELRPDLYLVAIYEVLNNDGYKDRLIKNENNCLYELANNIKPHYSYFKEIK